MLMKALLEPENAAPNAPWMKKKAENLELEDSPSEPAIVIEHYARQLQSRGLPPLVPRSFIDGTLEDRTVVQQQLELLGADVLRTFRIQDEPMYAWTKDYEAVIRAQMKEKPNQLSEAYMERFISIIVKRHKDSCITFSLLGYLVVEGLDEVPHNERAHGLSNAAKETTEKLINLLFDYTLIIRHATSTTTFWLHFPGAGALCRQLVAHRTESIARLGKTRWKEMTESDLLGRGGVRVLRGVRVELPVDVLGADLIGRGIAQRIRTTGGLYYRVPR